MITMICTIIYLDMKLFMLSYKILLNLHSLEKQNTWKITTQRCIMSLPISGTDRATVIATQMKKAGSRIWEKMLLVFSLRSETFSLSARETAGVSATSPQA